MVGSSQPLENRFPPHPRRLLWRSCTRVFLAGGVRSFLCCSFSVHMAGWAVMRAACGEGKPRPEQAVSVFAGVSTQLGRPGRSASCSVGAVNSSLSWHEVRLTSSGQFFESGVRVAPVSQSLRNVSAPRCHDNKHSRDLNFRSARTWPCGFWLHAFQQPARWVCFQVLPSCTDRCWILCENNDV